MNIENDTTPITTPAAAMPAKEPPQTKNQLRASALAESLAIKTKWKTLVGEARMVWPRLQAEELVKVAGNFHVLAGLVQLRCQLSREEADRQVQAFFDRHYAPVTPAVPSPGAA